MSFRDGNFSQRFGQMGDLAEGIIEENYPQALIRYGLNRPAIVAPSWPVFIWNKPDFIAKDHLLEVMGCGDKQRWVFKLPKVAAMTEWDEHLELRWALYDSKNNRFAIVSHGWVKERVFREIDARRVSTFEDSGVNYVEIACCEIDPVLWHPVV